MINNQVALKYSNALLELGKEKGSLVLIQDELGQIWETIEMNEDLKQTFFHKRISPVDKKAIIKQIFTAQVSKDVLNFINLLIDNRREQYIESIINRFKILVNEEEAIVEIEVITAIELTEELKNQLINKLNQLLDYKIVISLKVDSEIIGGMVLKFNDFIVDGSIKNSLNKLQESIRKVPASMLGV